MRTVSQPWRLLALLPALAAASWACGCGGGSHAQSSGALVPVSEADFAITAPHQLRAGDVTFRVHNEGPDQHEFIVVRSPSGRLPLRADGVTVDEETLQREEVGSLDPGSSGAIRELAVHLQPGRYVLFCNMSGHYMGGMHSTLVVSQ